MELWGARNQQPYQPQLHCFPPFHSALGNPKKTGASNLHWRSKSSERCHNWACFPCSVGGRVKKTRQSGLKKRHQCCRSWWGQVDLAAQWLAFETIISKHPAELQKCCPLYLSPLWKERDWCQKKKSVVCMTASWSECDQRVHEEYGKRRQTWYYC